MFLRQICVCVCILLVKRTELKGDLNDMREGDGERAGEKDGERKVTV